MWCSLASNDCAMISTMYARRCAYQSHYRRYRRVGAGWEARCTAFGSIRAGIFLPASSAIAMSELMYSPLYVTVFVGMALLDLGVACMSLDMVAEWPASYV
jgi:hypothetical protein